MDDIRAIDIQNRIFSVDIDKHIKFWNGYEMQKVAQAVWKGAIIKKGLSKEDSWKVMADLWPGSVPDLIEEMDDVGIELVFIDQFMTYSWHDKKRDVIVTIDEMDKIVEQSGGRVVPGGGYNPLNIGESLAELEEGVRELPDEWIGHIRGSFQAPPRMSRPRCISFQHHSLGFPAMS